MISFKFCVVFMATTSFCHVFVMYLIMSSCMYGLVNTTHTKLIISFIVKSSFKRHISKIHIVTLFFYIFLHEHHNYSFVVLNPTVLNHVNSVEGYSDLYIKTCVMIVKQLFYNVAIHLSVFCCAGFQKLNR